MRDRELYGLSLALIGEQDRYRVFESRPAHHPIQDVVAAK